MIGPLRDAHLEDARVRLLRGDAVDPTVLLAIVEEAIRAREAAAERRGGPCTWTAWRMHR